MSKRDQLSIKISRVKSALLSVSIIVWLSACSSTEPVTETVTQPAVEAPSPVPEWYNEAQPGDLSEGVVSGYGRAAGTDAQLAIENARRLASDNLAYWIDSKLEEARRGQVTENSTAGESEFIREIRAAAATFYLPASEHLSFQTGSYEEDGVIYAVVRADLPEEALLSWAEAVESTLDNSYQQIWTQLVDTALIQE